MAHKVILIPGDGTGPELTESTRRVLEATGVGAGILDGLFAAAVTPEERQRYLAEAYRLQARRKAFRQRSNPDLDV